jgi:hypothetical protein
LCETIWSLTSPRAKRISGPKKFHSSPKKDFFNTIDPTETWAAQDFRGAKALFVPSLKRDIVPSIGHAHDLRRGGVAWQSTSDGKNSYSHWAAQQLRGRSRRAGSSLVSWKPKKERPMTSLIPDFATLERRLAGLPRGEVSSPGSCTNRRFKDGRAAFPQEWHCRGR